MSDMRYWRVLVVIDEVPGETIEGGMSDDYETAINDQSTISRHTYVQFGDADDPTSLASLVFEAGEDAAGLASRIISRA